MAPALFCCARQSLTQNFGVKFCAAQGIQDMYVIEISRTGIGNAAGQHSLYFFCQYGFMVIGEDADRALIEQQRIYFLISMTECYSLWERS